MASMVMASMAGDPRIHGATDATPKPVRADAAWTAVLTRDRTQDGSFVYAVGTTGVYCRPSCPSRRPLRSNVRFFSTPLDAERSGYRPCRRCRPHAVAGTSTERSVAAARAYLDQHDGGRVTLRRLAREVGLSPAYLQRAFTRLVGLSPKAYVDALRRDRLKARLRTGESVTRATYAAGFGSTSTVYRRQASALGITPGLYRRGGERTSIMYGIVDSSLGRVLVARTERGVCAVTLGDRDAALERALAAEFPAATRVRDDDAVASWASGVVDAVDGRGDGSQLPLDLRGTAFQMRVWRALQRIPAGETRSYGDIAATIGQPRAARAVARACATNRVAVIVPCHRVVASSGDASGYRWGVERKRHLLQRERGAGR
jgi:AraC family transcriptional regulator, regulatory protein of adaptative response / methylated-DNA-[protein]-cysteine methyltransferase